MSLLLFFLIIISLSVSVAVSTYYFFRFLRIQKFRKQLVDILGELEGKYQQLIKQRMTLLALEDKSLETDQEKIEEEVFTIIRPNIEELISFLNSTKVHDSKSGYYSKVFPNLTRVVEEMMFEKRNNQFVKLGEDYEDRVIRALRNGMKADMAQRILDWKTGQTYASS